MTADRITDLLTAAALLAGLGFLTLIILLEAKARQERRQVPEWVPEAPAVPAPALDALEKAQREDQLRIAYVARRKSKVQREIDRMVKEAGCV